MRGISTIAGLLLTVFTFEASGAPYYGQLAGQLTTNAHQVSGTVYIVDSKRIRIRNFMYDGQGPDAFFWVGTTDSPDSTGTIVPNEMGSTAVLGQYMNADITLTLPGELTTDQIKWISVWCRRFASNFGFILLPGSATCTPAEQSLGDFTTRAHGVVGTVTVKDSRTIVIESFTYDGTGPDAYFYVGTGDIKSDNGQRLAVGLDTVTPVILPAYNNERVEIRLPEGTNAMEFEWLSVYCVSASTNFGEVQIPNTLCVPPYAGPPMYWGEEMGSLSTESYEVQGTIYVVDDNRLFIRGFSYNGGGPDAFFYIGIKGTDGTTPTEGGVYLTDENGLTDQLGAYDNVNIVLNLPADVSATQVAWFSVWCRQVGVDFGSLTFPDNFQVPAPVDIGPFTEANHGVGSGDVIVEDKRTLRIPQFSYDGTGPDAFFLVGTGTPSATTGTQIPNELGSMDQLGAYNNKDIKLTLPPGLDVDRIDYISVYCVSVGVDFGHIMLPAGVLKVPPFLPAARLAPLPNCKAMNDMFNVAWEVKDSDIVFEFTGNIGVEKGYMAFGISGSESSSAMGGSDPMIVYLDNGSPTLVDYTINAYSLCSGGTGVCPDTIRSGADDLEVLDMRLDEGVTMVRFKRPLVTGDSTDKDFITTGDQYVVWAMGEVNGLGQVTKHTTRVIGNMQMNFGAEMSNDCERVVGTPEEEVTPWPATELSGMDTKTFTARIGLSGGKKGYGGITGSTSWGIAWYLNGILIPELTLKRGETYTFNVEGGNNPSNQAKYHPFYITNDNLGGYVTKTAEERQNIVLYAGTTEMNGVVKGTEGRYCEFKGSANPNDYDTFAAYKDTLTLECEAGDTGSFTFTPTADTPDLIYYQCFTHNYLGWKIHVVDDYEVNGGIRAGASYFLLMVLAILLTIYHIAN